jgi:hypothetical protein
VDVHLERLDQRVHRARALYRERRTEALRCGCGRRCASCRTSVEETSKSLQRALSDLDQAQELLEQRRQGSTAPGRRSA